MKFSDFFRKRTPPLGLALSGGATHGAAHIGILQILEREGIRPQMVAGTSAGALIGAAYCAGIPLNELSDLFLSMSWPTLLRISIKNPLSLFDTQPMEEFIKKKIGDCNFEDLQIPFAAIACDIVTGERIVLDHGPLAPAIRASAAIPGLFSPVEINGRLLVDGGIVDNLPVKQVRTMGAKFIIASDVSERGKLSKRPENPFEIVLSMICIMQARAALADKNACDCYIHPEISQYSSWGFADSPIVLEEGKKAAEAALPLLVRFQTYKI
ncbi:MAG: patatin-like phospholipase family protein [Chloroflexi bacterium]|nr:patatin-like phospholipase family protein [Chloroflexota bacterium]